MTYCEHMHGPTAQCHCFALSDGPDHDGKHRCWSHSERKKDERKRKGAKHRLKMEEARMASKKKGKKSKKRSPKKEEGEPKKKGWTHTATFLEPRDGKLVLVIGARSKVMATRFIQHAIKEGLIVDTFESEEDEDDGDDK